MLIIAYGAWWQLQPGGLYHQGKPLAVRLMIVAILSAVEETDFLYLPGATELTRGSPSSHLSRLESTGCVEIEQGFVGKTSRTVCRLTAPGL